MSLTELMDHTTDRQLAEYLRSSRKSTQAQIDAQAHSRACYDLTPADRLAQSTQRTLFGESAH